MPTWCLNGAHCKWYKGVFILVLVFFILANFFGAVIDNNKPPLFFNTTKLHEEIRDVDQMHGPLQHKMLWKHKQYQYSNASTTKGPAMELSYVVTNPPVAVIENANLTGLFEYTAPVDTTNSTVLDVRVFTTISPYCPDVTSSLVGRVPIVRSPVPTVVQLEQQFRWLQPGGHWQPDCKVTAKVAIVIPFRNRGEHLLLFLQHMHPFLRRQQLDYTIFIIEQDGNGSFNRAMLMNIGYVEAVKRRDFDCFIFHDIDLLPEDDRNLYSCPEQPRHMSVAVDVFNYRLPYPAIFGGVSAISTKHFKLLNGFSNSFWGWGGEDDDMSNRIRYHHLFISRYPLTIARYTMLTHKKDKPSPNRYDVLKQGQTRFDKDGLNSLKYNVVQAKEKLLYTWILVSIEAPHR
ncbi:beta-1,4-N-acetylgalactosaminyltransferase bre-4 [Aethina tumida]|uniref:beta-1,4-N-acetylgalactosaminyltransferase bre-4 n=1 Tax=Aethina tumida TaxID=116153 RepID=UPI0021483C5D|nr:beta-1,4-N-acetylgalactosaminyltransferase bre-4 [Aethina tumida]